MTTKDTIRKHFCKNTGLPINITADPYFASRIRLYRAERDYLLFQELLRKYAAETGNTDTDDGEGYLQYYHTLQERIVKAIQATDAYAALQTADMQQYAHKTAFPANDIYKDTNVGKQYISIDMSKANYTAMVHFAKHNDTTFVPDDIGYHYAKFMLQYTSNPFLINAKHLRQVIFGKCCSNRLAAYEKHMMHLFLDKLLVAGVPESSIVSLRTDEIIITQPDDEQLSARIDLIAEENDFPLVYKHFTLAKIIDETNRIVGYLKVFDAKTIGTSVFDPDCCEIKCVQTNDAAPVMRLLLGETITAEDLLFTQDGKLATFLSAPKLQICGI